MASSRLWRVAGWGCFGYILLWWQEYGRYGVVNVIGHSPSRCNFELWLPTRRERQWLRSIGATAGRANNGRQDRGQFRSSIQCSRSGNEFSEVSDNQRVYNVGAASG